MANLIKSSSNFAIAGIRIGCIISTIGAKKRGLKSQLRISKPATRRGVAG